MWAHCSLVVVKYFKTPQSIDCPNLNQFMLQLNFHLVAPNFYNYITTLDNCCDERWYITCNKNRISFIRFRGYNVNGTINTTLLPSTLDTLLLSYNKLSGTFPNLTKLVKLTNLEMNNNNFGGSIYGKLPISLKYTDLSFNNLNGTIPNLPVLTSFHSTNNQFDSVENELNLANYVSIDLSHNKIRGTINMLKFVSGLYSGLKFRDNLIDKILALPPNLNTNCDVSMNNISQEDLRNFTICNSAIQKYSEPVKFESCQFVDRIFQKLGFIYPEMDQNCCKSSGVYTYVVCAGQNVTELRIQNTLNRQGVTIDGYAFSVSDIPPTLRKLTIGYIFDRPVKLPPNIPGNIKEITLIVSNIRGELPKFSEGLEILSISNSNLSQTWPILPSTLKVLKVAYCNLTGPIPNLPPNLEELQIQGNFLTGPFPVFPASLKTVILGDSVHEGNSFNDKLILQNPTTLILGDTNIIDVQINSTSALSSCDLSFNPLLNSTFVGNYTKCTKYYLSYLPQKLQIATVQTLDSSNVIETAFLPETANYGILK
eukprot:NODE_299_length_10456_cov_1.003669.p1 type:complete len:540 gc:universal NODE_299_length_10456_cov_1.003669:8180-9799(+)